MEDRVSKRRIVKSFKTKLNPSDSIKKILKNFSGTYRVVYNKSMEIMEEYGFMSVQSHKHFLNQLELLESLKKVVKKQYKFVNEVESGVIKAAACHANLINNRDYPYSISPMMRKKDGLKFKTTTQLKISEDSVYIPKCGKIKLFEKNYLPQDALLHDITIYQKGNGWWISFSATINVEEKKIERNFDDILKIDFKDDGTLVVNNKEYENIIKTARYQKEFKRLRGLLQKYKRQCEANSEYHRRIRKTLVVSRNMLKLRKQIETSTCRLYNMKLDYFRKIAKDLTRTKSGCALFLSNSIVRKQQNSHLSRAHREAGTAHFFDILHSKLQHSGFILHRMSMDGVVRPELQGIMACGGLDEYRRMAQKSSSMKQVLSLAA